MKRKQGVEVATRKKRKRTTVKKKEVIKTVGIGYEF